MIKKKIRNLEQYDFEDLIRDNGCKDINDIINLLFGVYEDYYYTDYVIKHRYGPTDKRSFFNRLNVLWVYPIFIICVPFRYLFLGEVGISEDSKLGKVLTYLTGELR